MVDEAKISPAVAYFNESRAKTVINNLQKRNINGFYVPDGKQALKTVMEMIPAGVVVTRADSVTLEQLGIIDAVKERNQNKFLDPFRKNPDGSRAGTNEERDQVHREGFFADILLSGTNAITLDGKLVNIDGYGSRVAKMIFGPKKVIIVVGTNKIVKDVDEALARIHSIAAPLNAARHFVERSTNDDDSLVPCAKTGKCADCSHPGRLCRYTTIIEGAFLQHKERINVVIVGENLGY